MRLRGRLRGRRRGRARVVVGEGWLVDGQMIEGGGRRGQRGGCNA